MSTTTGAAANSRTIGQGPIILSGGYVSPEAFPTASLAGLAAELLRVRGAEALQYGAEAGYAPLRRLIADWLLAEQVQARPEEIVTVMGSKQAIDMCARTFCAGGGAVAVAEPVYRNALKIFSTAGTGFVTVPGDDRGMDVDALERLLADAHPGGAVRPRLIYVIPDFNNPDSAVMPAERREKLVALATRYEIPILEDNPYRWTRFDGEPILPLQHFDRSGIVISTGTFSKLFAPGLRVAWVHARAEFLEKIMAFKADGGISPLTQMLTYEFFREAGSREQHQAFHAGVLRARRDVALQSLEQHLSDRASWNRPSGGNYLWVRFGEGVDTDALAAKAQAAGVVYFPGSGFYARRRPPRNYLRLCYSFEANERMKTGIAILADVFSSSAPTLERGRDGGTAMEHP